MVVSDIRLELGGSNFECVSRLSKRNTPNAHRSTPRTIGPRRSGVRRSASSGIESVYWPPAADRWSYLDRRENREGVGLRSLLAISALGRPEKTTLGWKILILTGHPIVTIFLEIRIELPPAQRPPLGPGGLLGRATITTDPNVCAGPIRHIVRQSGPATTRIG